MPTVRRIHGSLLSITCLYAQCRGFTSFFCFKDHLVLPELMLVSGLNYLGFKFEDRGPFLVQA